MFTLGVKPRAHRWIRGRAGEHTAWVSALLVAFSSIVSVATPTAYAATSPVLVAASGYSVLGGAGVTCVGTSTTSGSVGVSPGTSITGFPAPCTAGGGTQSNNASAIAAQAENLTAFGTLNQTCDQTFGAVDLTATFPSGVGPGVYCSTSSFTLTGSLNLTGSGVWIFKTVSTLITSPGSSVTGGDPCNVWWRIGSSATLETTTSFIGSILALNGVTALKTGATLNGRVMAQAAGTVTLDSNTINGPVCAGAATATPTVTSTATATSTVTATSAPSGGGGGAPAATAAPTATVTPAPTATTAPAVPSPTEVEATATPVVVEIVAVEEVVAPAPQPRVIPSTGEPSLAPLVFGLSLVSIAGLWLRRRGQRRR